MAITCWWQSHPGPLAWDEERLRDHGAPGVSQPHAQLTCSAHLLPCKNTAGSRTMSLQATPALLCLCRGDKGPWGRIPRGSWWQGSGKRAVHPTVGTKDVLGKLGWSQFSECPFARSSINLIWGLISLSHKHETVSTFLHLSKLSMDTEHDQSTFLSHIHEVLLNLHPVCTQRYSYRKWLKEKWRELWACNELFFKNHFGEAYLK